MSKRQEDFFNKATEEIENSYTFQNDESYSESDVRDIATSLAEYGYQYAVENVLAKVQELYPQAAAYYEQPEVFVEQIRKAMEE